MNKLPEDMLEAIKNTNLDEATEKLVIQILYAERTKKEQKWDGDAVEMIDKYLLTEQGGQNVFDF